MGFVYNNVFEAVCKAYLELNGYFVLTNTFVALMNASESDGRRRRLEADIIAYKLENTFLGGYVLDTPPPNDEGNNKEFFAGEKRQDNLIYCEAKANLSNDQRIITKLFDDNDHIPRKIELIQRRFGINPRCIILAFSISHETRQDIAQKDYLYKDYRSMLRFIKVRLEAHPDEKLRAQYNDPILETMRMLQALQRDGQIDFRFI